MTNMEQKYVYEATQLNCFSSPVIFVFVMFFVYVRNVRKREQKISIQGDIFKSF